MSSHPLRRRSALALRLVGSHDRSQWQANLEAGASGPAIYRDAARVLLDDAGNDGEPQAGAFSDVLAGKERVEDLVHSIGGDSATIVLDRDHNLVGIGFGTNVDFPLLALAPALEDGVASVGKEVGPHLMDLARSVQEGQGRIEIRGHLDRMLELIAEQDERGLDGIIDLNRFDAVLVRIGVVL